MSNQYKMGIQKEFLEKTLRIVINYVDDKKEKEKLEFVIEEMEKKYQNERDMEGLSFWTIFTTNSFLEDIFKETNPNFWKTPHPGHLKPAVVKPIDITFGLKVQKDLYRLSVDILQKLLDNSEEDNKWKEKIKQSDIYYKYLDQNTKNEENKNEFLIAIISMNEFLLKEIFRRLLPPKQSKNRLNTTEQIEMKNKKTKNRPINKTKSKKKNIKKNK